MNMQFMKQPQTLVTYKANKQKAGGPPYTRPDYETLDYIMTTKRWKNAFKNVESDVSSNINSDHYPFEC